METISDWIKIIDCIEKNYYDYDSFVIIHGTDTMAYTASAISFALVNLAKPVILTGAQVSSIFSLYEVFLLLHFFFFFFLLPASIR